MHERRRSEERKEVRCHMHHWGRSSPYSICMALDHIKLDIAGFAEDSVHAGQHWSPVRSQRCWPGDTSVGDHRCSPDERN
ncbi:hypothetical protein CBM2610_U30005 [Cupriavidus taiwanensis]|nr:hypothetical protein CBM2610_U30005 [Cupriavidus taiwanensis]